MCTVVQPNLSRQVNSKSDLPSLATKVSGSVCSPVVPQRPLLFYVKGVSVEFETGVQEVRSTYFKPTNTIIYCWYAPRTHWPVYHIPCEICPACYEGATTLKQIPREQDQALPHQKYLNNVHMDSHQVQ